MQNTSVKGLEQYVCPTCDLKQAGRLSIENAVLDELTKTFINLTKLPRTRSSKTIRTAAVESIPRLVQHRTLTPGLFGTYLGEYCLKAVSSSTREVRIAAGRALCAFLSNTEDAKTVLSNRDRAFDWLRSILEKSSSSLQETTILALSQLSRSVQPQAGLFGRSDMSRYVDGNEEKFAVLPLLVDFLGHPNHLLSALAFDEVCLAPSRMLH